MQYQASIVLLTYNQANYVRKAFESIVGQEGGPYEIIISDDCSSDGTLSILQQLTRQYSGPHKLMLLGSGVNRGLAGNINASLARATSPWVVMAAGDDISEPNRTSAILAAASETPNAVAICSGFSVIDESEKTLAYSCPDRLATRPDAFANIAQAFFSQNQGRGYYVLTGAAAAWRKDVFERFDSLPSNFKVYEDIIFTSRAIMLGQTITLPICLVRYRRHAEATSNWVGAISRNQSRARKWGMLQAILNSTHVIKGDIERAAEMGIVSDQVSSEALRQCEIRIRYLEDLCRWPQMTILEKTKTILKHRRKGILNHVLGHLTYSESTSRTPISLHV